MKPNTPVTLQSRERKFLIAYAVGAPPIGAAISSGYSFDEAEREAKRILSTRGADVFLRRVRQTINRLHVQP